MINPLIDMLFNDRLAQTVGFLEQLPWNSRVVLVQITRIRSLAKIHWIMPCTTIAYRIAVRLFSSFLKTVFQLCSLI